MSKVNVRLKEILTAPGNVAVTVESVLIASQSVLSGSFGVLPGKQTLRTDVTGYAQFILMTGRYRVTAVSASAGGALAYTVLIDVPDDNVEYEHTELIAEGAGTFVPVIGGGSPDAAEAVAGLVKVAAGGDVEAAPRVVYTKTQVDALLAAAGSGGSAGSGTPEGVTIGNRGGTYWDYTNKVFYVKDSGIGTNTGWRELIA